ncbi:hypothetical protein EVAR_49506_1 [Eumeta japonica]|uniref:Uncharacterized protein n=1 Tax=Eumeta variegata TaxID=151549 RepID=A0A4C1VV41_EUMVA|nr:hypothetical protein EVAR_49506_1 [Eumeta japonica]
MKINAFTHIASIKHYMRTSKVTYPGQDLPYGFLSFSPGPRGFKGPPPKLSQSKIDDMRKNMWAPSVIQTSRASGYAPRVTGLFANAFEARRRAAVFRNSIVVSGLKENQPIALATAPRNKTSRLSRRDPCLSGTNRNSKCLVIGDGRFPNSLKTVG